MTRWPIGVFARADAGLGVSVDDLATLGVESVQLHAPYAENRTPRRAAELSSQLADAGVSLEVVFGGFAGESYADIPTVARTVGLVPAATRQARLDEMRHISDFARQMGCGALGLHLGFVPHDRATEDYDQIVDVARRLCDHCAANEQNVHLETGQEPVAVLTGLIEDVARPNLFVNFDPANMILYGVGQPLAALRSLDGRVRSVHCKDAIASDQPGVTWGTEVALGQGAVDVRRFLETLAAIGYCGALTIERELAGQPARQLEDVRHAVCLLRSLQQQLDVR